MNTKQLKAKVLDLAIHGKLLSPETVAELKKSPDYETADVLLEKIRREKEEKIAKGELKRDKKDSYIFVGDDKRHYEKFADGTVKDIEDEIPFDVPEGWAWCRLGGISTLKGGKRIPSGLSATKKKTEHIYIRVTDMKNYSISDEDLVYIDNLIFDKIKQYTISKTDLYLTIAGTIGRVGEVPEQFDGMNLTENALKLTNIFINKRYLMFVLNSSFVQDYFESTYHQVAMPKLSLINASKTIIPIPPFFEQEKVVSTIENTFKQIDLLEQNKSDLQTVIEQTKSKILDLAIHGKLVPQDANDEPASVLLEKLRAEKEEKIAKGELKRDKNDSFIYKGSDNCYYQRFADGHEEDISEEIPCELPESWAWCRIKDICTINPKNKLDDNLEVSFIPMTLIDAGYTNHHGQETRVWKKIKTGFTHFAENDVAIAKISPCFENKKSVILKNLKNGYGAGTTELYILRACSIVLPEYLFWIVKTDSFINEGVGNFSGVVGQQRLARDIVENYYIPLPPINEQKRIISKIVSVFEKLDTIENNIE